VSTACHTGWDTHLDGADLDQLLEDAEGGVEGSTLDAEDS